MFTFRYTRNVVYLQYKRNISIYYDKVKKKDNFSVYFYFVETINHSLFAASKFEICV